MASNSATHPPIKEHYVDGRPSGFEAVDERAELDDDSSYDPEMIRVENKIYSLGQVLEWIESKDLDLAPDFQRRRVWDMRQKNLLIESLLLRIPLPSFYFFGDTEGKLHVMDGFQRLSSIYQFVKGSNDTTFGEPFRLAGNHLHYLVRLDGQGYEDLAQKWRRRIHQTQLIVNQIDPLTPEHIKTEIFSRINTLGTALNPQELRHGLSQKRSRLFLKKLTEMPAFFGATGNFNTSRLADLELALRFCCFKTIDWEQADLGANLDEILNAFTVQLDDPSIISDDQLNALAAAFQTAMVNAAALFGDQAFRKRPGETATKHPLNKPLFDCVAVILSEFDTAELSAHGQAIIDRLSQETAPEATFEQLITQETQTKERIQARFAACRRFFAEAMAP